ncbi:hypothetical protein [Clostridium sp.]|uniref:hypothetical protein n=1 Tax=Clostridium sp. TaxID=1506 RepID=UPI001B4D9B6C|nr:hypothetical protein [Clostridium sp.]MBP3916695.1 hypothetical protein [Clostridium sp.]
MEVYNLKYIHDNHNILEELVDYCIEKYGKIRINDHSSKNEIVITKRIADNKKQYLGEIQNGINAKNNACKSLEISPHTLFLDKEYGKMIISDLIEDNKKYLLECLFDYFGPASNKYNSDYNIFQIEDSINRLSNLATHFAFRNGPVENMHTNGLLSDDDMKTLNKYMMNRIATLLTLIKDNKIASLELLLSFYDRFGTDWDRAVLDYSELERMIELGLGIKKKFK